MQNIDKNNVNYQGTECRLCKVKTMQGEEGRNKDKTTATINKMD